MPELEATVAAQPAGGRGEPLPVAALGRAATLIGLAALGDGHPLPITSHTAFLEHRHIEEGKPPFR